MIIISARKFRDNQNEIFRHAISEEVILTTVHYGSFRLVPVAEGESTYSRPTVSSAPAAPVVQAPVTVAAPVPPEPAVSEPVSAPVEAASDPVIPVENEPIKDSYDSSSMVNSAPEVHEETPKTSGDVYVDPSLLTLEEFYKQEGIEIPSKKKGLFGKIFNK